MNVSRTPRRRSRQRGSAMIEFAVVGPVLTLLGTTILQYSLLFNAKNMVNHATFMAARAGSMAQADLDRATEAYARALIPLYGGGRNAAELAEALGKATADIAGNVRIELLNPTKESFDDWNDPDLAARYGRRAIPNGALGSRDPSDVRSASGQNIHDANLIKLKVTHGYELKVPLAGSTIQFMMKWGDTGADPFVSALYDARRIPIVSHVTLQMQSDALEPGSPVSVPGRGNAGRPTDPGFSEGPGREPPRCQTVGCDVLSRPPPPVDPGGGGGGPVCVEG